MGLCCKEVHLPIRYFNFLFSFSSKFGAFYFWSHIDYNSKRICRASGYLKSKVGLGNGTVSVMTRFEMAFVVHPTSTFKFNTPFLWSAACDVATEFVLDFWWLFCSDQVSQFWRCIYSWLSSRRHNIIHNLTMSWHDHYIPQWTYIILISVVVDYIQHLLQLIRLDTCYNPRQGFLHLVPSS